MGSETEKRTWTADLQVFDSERSQKKVHARMTFISEKSYSFASQQTNSRVTRDVVVFSIIKRMKGPDPPLTRTWFILIMDTKAEENDGRETSKYPSMTTERDLISARRPELKKKRLGFGFGSVPNIIVMFLHRK